ncbi:agmatine deiminase family protein [Roseibacillus ishigakijimensis]|uniref:Agmatine deiminase family protein n=1 Tax=Roseibacillus ishigakijimensis TaxID=454146 RepID=A0A934RNX6_9BACT|nr:agmatine deiminase family protein [Roseibacillus ishigakijimensis]MBK1835267.1 agmatine deiminase family protein [Roseibacillus ishigakijimensis]
MMQRNEDRFVMPAEWSPVEAIWLSWPVAPQLWGGIARAEVEAEFARLVAVIARFAQVRLCVQLDQRERVVELVPQAEVFAIATDDVWCRDHGPTFLRHPRTGAVAMVDWRYNAWGGKFPFEKDNRVPAAIAALQQIPRSVSSLVCEGGALESNGAGRILTTESVLLNGNRNPDWDREAVATELKAQLGAVEILWLRAGLEHDDTDGHIDMVARFVSEDAVLAVEPASETLRDNWKRLEAAGLQVRALPYVGEIAEGIEGSYANFLIVNEGVVVPQYGLAGDAEALAVVAEAFPGKEVVGFDCRLLGREGGAVHCLTQGQWRRGDVPSSCD